PSNLFVRGATQSSALPNKGQVYRKIGRRKLVPYYDRAEIEDGAIAGRGLEICWLKNQTDLLFTQIQGSARVRLENGSTLRIDSERSKTPFHRLMIAQDTGSAIVGPARADLYFGAGTEAGRVSGRLRHNARFVILIPKSLDPVARGRKVPVPDERPSEKIAKL